MRLKITGSNTERFNQNLTDFLNVATMICLKGSVPIQYDIDNAERLGRWWYREKDNNRFQLLGIANNDWLNIIEEGENFIMVEFNFRYDSGLKRKNTISNLMVSWFDFVEPIYDKSNYLFGNKTELL